MTGRLRRALGSAAVLVMAVLGVGMFAASGGVAQAPAQDVNASLEVMLVIDVSGSMTSAIEATKAAAEQFVAAMPATVAIGLETFGDRVRVLTPPTTDRALLASLIAGISLERNTALYDGVIEATRQFSPTVPNKVVVLLSDGRDVGSDAALLIATLNLVGVRVEAISLTTPETDLDSLSALGTVTSAEDAAGVSAAFARVAGLLTIVADTPPASTAPSPTTSPPTTTPPPTTTAPSTTTRPTTAPSSTVPSSTVAAAGATASTPPTAPAATGTTTDGGPSSTVLLLGGAAVFLGLFLLALMVMPRPRVSKARLGIDETPSMSGISRRAVSAAEAALVRRGSRDELATNLAVASISMQPGEFVGTVVVVAVVCGLIGLLALGALGAITIAMAVCLGARFFVTRRAAKRRTEFEDQLPDVLQALAAALRTGFGLSQALEVVAAEAQEPARTEFSQLLVEGRVGRDLPAAMRALARRMRSEDLEWVVSAIEINRDIGGNLSDVLTAVGNTVRERQRMNRQVATYTAEGRMSARVLIAMPAVMALWQWRANPDQFEKLFSGGGLVALVIGGILLVVGSFWVNRIVNSVSI